MGRNDYKKWFTLLGKKMVHMFAGLKMRHRRAKGEDNDHGVGSKKDNSRYHDGKSR